MAYDFKYIRTGTGELSGPSMIWQTEQALTQIGTYADEANTKADEALDTANTALNKANEAAEAAERAQNTADAAQAAANHAQETADAAQVAAGNAQNTADKALETAQKGVADAAKAQAAADKAQATADAAQDAADAAQLTADNAQNAADKAQDAANAAQQTANDALNAASNSQGSANVAQDTADNALLVAQSTQQAFYEHVREYTPQIAKALGEFEADNTTVNFDNFTDSVKLYITSPNASITGPNGKVNSPFYLWNFTTDDRSSTAQFVYAANGLTYSRYGTMGQNDLVPGTDTYTLENNKKNAILTCKGVASGMTITKSGSLTNTWTASDTHDSYIAGTWNIKGITNGTIDLNGVTIANLSDTGFYPTGQQQLQEDNTSFVIEDMTYSADDGLTIKVTVRWLNIDSQISWDSWKVDAPAVDNVTIKYNSSNELQAKDIAINGDASDLVSARGFFYDTYLPYYPGRGSNPVDDFNLLTLPGTYHIVVSRDTLNRPDIRLFTGSGTNDGILEITRINSASTVSSHQRLNQRFTVFGSDRKTWSRNQDTNAVAWYAWEQELRTGDIGDGIRITNGIISVPEMEGATASANGVSGLVPPPLKADLGKSLGANGEWTYPADVAVGGDVNDLASMRGQIGQARELGDNVNYNTVVEAGFYLINANGSVNAPFAGNAFFLQVFRSKKDTLNKNFYQIAYNYSSARERTFIRQYRTASKDWSPWSESLTSSNIGDGITVNNGIISVPEYEGATASTAGTSGLVPPAGKGQQARFLRADGSWVDIDSGEGTYLPIAGGSMAGNISYAATSTTGGAITIKAMTKGVVYVTPSANTTISFSMPDNLRGGIVVVLILIDGGSKTITWGSNVVWANGEVPELTADGTDILTFFFEKVIGNLKVVGVLSAKDVK